MKNYRMDESTSGLGTRLLYARGSPSPGSEFSTTSHESPIAIATDLSERDRLVEANAVLASIVRSSDDAIIGKSLGGIIRSWNEGAERLFGYTRAEAVGRSISLIIPPERRDEERTILERLGRGERVERLETIRVGKDGRHLEISLSSSPIRDAEGRIVGAAKVARDISGQMRAEREIFALNAELRSSLERTHSLRQVDMAITGGLDLPLTLKVIVEQAIAQLKVDVAGIWISSPEKPGLELAARLGFHASVAGESSQRLDEGPAGRAVLERRTQHFLVPPGMPEGSFGPHRDEGLAAYWAVPLVAKGKVRGVLEIGHRLPIGLGPDLLEFLESLASQAAIAIENAELYEGLRRSNLELSMAYDSTIEGWARALDLRDRETEGHSRRVAELGIRTARALGLEDAELVHLRRGALLHDIGKMGIPDAILLKPGRLTEEERSIMQRHPDLAHQMLAPIQFLRPALDIPYCHHEKWDGTGYPRGLKGEQIPLAARIFSVADIWDALSSDRPYRQGWPEEKTVAHIRNLAGTHLDPDVVESFLQFVAPPASSGV